MKDAKKNLRDVQERDGLSRAYSDTFSPDGHVRYKIDPSRKGEFDEAYSGNGG